MLLRIEAIVLLAMAVALAWPVPVTLARARWARRDPLVALILWQAVGLAGGLSILGAGCTLAVSDLHRGWLGGIADLLSGTARPDALGWLGVGLTLAVGLWLVGVAAASALRVSLARHEHRRRLDAVAEKLDTWPERAAPATAVASPARGVHASPRLATLPDVCWIDHPIAVAYCLPGLRNRIVVSRGALRALDPEELGAVLAHERAHARSRHDLVIQPFVAWRDTFPFLPPTADALGTVEGLVEMLADDQARRDCSPAALQHALRRLAAAHLAVVPTATPQLAGNVDARVQRLSCAPRPLARPLRLLIVLTAVALILAPPIALILS